MKKKPAWTPTHSVALALSWALLLTSHDLPNVSFCSNQKINRKIHAVQPFKPLLWLLLDGFVWSSRTVQDMEMRRLLASDLWEIFLQNHREIVNTLLSRVRCVYYIDLHNSLNLNKLHLHLVQQCRQVSTSFFFLPVRLCLGSRSVKLLSQCNVVWLVHKGSYSATMEREGRGKEGRHVWVCVCAKHG